MYINIYICTYVFLVISLVYMYTGGTVVVIGNKGMTETNVNARALMMTESQIVGLLGVGSPEEGKEVLAGVFVCMCVCLCVCVCVCASLTISFPS